MPAIERRRVALAAVLLVVEYLLVSLLFDARELVPPSLHGLGDLAPMPIIAGVALLVLRASSDTTTTTTPTPTPPCTPTATDADAARSLSTTTVLALLATHLVAFAAFLSLCFHVRGRAHDLATAWAWITLAVITAASLAAFAFARADVRDVARRAAGPVVVATLVGVAAWAAGLGTGALWRPLARMTLYPVGTLVETLSSDAVVDVDHFIVGVERFKVRIDPVCSGYEGMGLVAVLLGAFVWTFRRTLRFPEALGLIVIAVVGAFVANVVRITALIYVGALGSHHVAVSGFHSKAGWLLFCAVALGTTWIARARVFQRRAPDDERAHAAPGGEQVRDQHENPTARYVVPLLALVAGALLAGLFGTGAPDHLELVALATAACALVWARATVRETLSPPSSPPAASALPEVRATALAVVVGVLVFVAWLVLHGAQLETDRLHGAADGGAGGYSGFIPAEVMLRTALDSWPASLAALWIITRLVMSIAVGPLVEELAFRGFLLRRIMAADFTAVRYRDVSALAVVASSAAFGALHDHWLAGTVAGLAYAAVASRTGRLRDAVVAHVVTNVLIAVAVLAFGRWALWT